MSEIGNPVPSRIQVTPVDWLKPGWIFALKKDGCAATRIDTPRGDLFAFVQTVLAQLEQIRQTPDVAGVFLSQDDCAVVTEYFPDTLYRTQK